MDRPTEPPGWLSDALEGCGLGRPSRLGAARGRAQIDLRPPGQDPLVLLLERAGGPSAHRLPFEGAHVRIGYAGGDRGEATAVICQRAGEALERHADELAGLFDTDASGLPADHIDDPAIGRQRRLEAPEWLTLALANVGAITGMRGSEQGLTLTIATTPRASVVCIMRPENGGHALSWATPQFGVAYVGHVPAAAGLCARIGEALIAVSDQLVALLAAPESAEPPPWADPLLLQLVAHSGRPETRAADIASLEAMSQRSWTGVEADALALAALRLDRPGEVLKLAERVERPGPLLRIVAAALRGEREEVLASLEVLTQGEATQGDAMHGDLLLAGSRLAASLKAHSAARRLAEARVGLAAPRAKPAAVIDLVRLRRATRDDPSELREWLSQAVTDLGESPQLRLKFARTAMWVGDFEVAEETLRRFNDVLPERHLFLAELHLWRGDTASARAYAAGVDATDDLKLRSDIALLLAGCDVLEGHGAGAVVTLEQLVDEHPEPWVAATWLCEAHMRLGDWARAEKADERSQAARHTLANAVVATLNRARRLIHSGRAGQGWEAARVDPDGLLDGRLDGWVPAEESDAARRGTVADGERVLSRVHAELGGNRTELPSRLDDGELRLFDDPRSPRMASAHCLYLLGDQGFAPTHRALEALRARWSRSPQPPCYLGELLLWWDRLEAAEASFQAAIDRGGTRWAYIGLGAVGTLQGRTAEALDYFERCVGIYGELEGATLVVYRGELYRRAGRTQEALEDLREALWRRPGRVGAWSNLALVHLDLGDATQALEAAAEVYRRVPHLLRQAARAESLPEDAHRHAQHLPALLERALTMMCGNRSSSIWSHRDADGVFRVLPDPAPLCDWARDNGSFAEMLATQWSPPP